jgi:phosphoribosylformylglycinamidine (FGAM) synthase PurS component
MQVGMHAEENDPQASIVERKFQGRGWPPVTQIKVEVTHNDKFT